MKHSKNFYSVWSKGTKLGLYQPSREDLWGLYINYELHKKMSFEEFCKNELVINKNKQI
jgi:hypothetical protein